MEWVPGITLFEWCRDRCREGYAQALQIASDVWLHVVRELAPTISCMAICNTGT